MISAVVFAAHDGNGQRFHLSTAETCPDKAGHLWMRSTIGAKIFSIAIALLILMGAAAVLVVRIRQMEPSE